MSACLQGEHEPEFSDATPTWQQTLYAQGGDGAFRRIVSSPLERTSVVCVCRHCRAVFVPRPA